MTTPPYLLRLRRAGDAAAVRRVLDDVLPDFAHVFPADKAAPILHNPNGNANMNALTGNTTDLRLLVALLGHLRDAGYTNVTVGEGTNSGPRYQLRGFNDIKAPLLAEATRNAREQAVKFATEAGASLGPLKNANQGAIRITGDDGNDFDDGSSRTKRLRVVSTFEYELR